ncbi:hypothetical protein [Streptosporangium vulgare]|uniref:hypothetical protein n=1 Tax=Streptosporangium vulgare TaxID=46190 RepID=UPI0031D1C4F0
MPRKHAAITGCVLAITALTATAVPAAAHPLTTGVATTAVTLKPPPGMIAALQRDLHLTQEQAQARLLNETRLAPVAAQLRAELGDTFGGSWLAGDLAQNPRGGYHRQEKNFPDHRRRRPVPRSSAGR